MQGLAKKDSSVSWQVDPGYLDYLKYVQTQQDIIKTKNRHIKDVLSPRLPVVVTKLDKPGDKLIGRVIGMGLGESSNEPRYMLIEGIDNKIHYILATQGMTKKRDGGDLRNGEVVYLERKEFYKEQQNQEPQKVSFILAESFRSFSDLKQAQVITNVDLFIINKFKENPHVPRVLVSDGEVKVQFIDLMRERVELMRKAKIILYDHSINQQKLDWTFNNNLKLNQRGPSLRLGAH